MRTLIRSALLADAPLATMGVVPEGVLAGDVDTPIVRPFLNLRWGNTVQGLDVLMPRELVVWVHDEPGDYSRIDAILPALRRILTGIEATRWTEASGQTGWVSVIEWNGDSGDLADDGHGTIVRTSAFSIIGSGH